MLKNSDRCVSLLALALLGAVQIPPPPPPPGPDGPSVRDALDQARRCIDGSPLQVDHDGRGQAARVVRALTALPGSDEWQRSKPVVERLVLNRRVQKRCLDELDKFQFSAPMSRHDLDIYRVQKRGLKSFWLSQAPYEAAVLAEFIDKKLATDDASISTF